MTFRRLPYYLLLVAVLLFLGAKLKTYAHHVRLGFATTAAGFLELATLLVMLAAVVIAASILFRGQRFRGVTGVIRARDVSLRTALHYISRIVREAFARRPILAILLSLCFLAIPIVLVALADAREPTTFGPREWIAAGIAELPFAAIALIALMNSNLNDETFR